MKTPQSLPRSPEELLSVLLPPWEQHWRSKRDQEFRGQAEPSMGWGSRAIFTPHPRSPCNDDEEVQPVPSVPQVAFFPKDSQGHHLHHHLHGKEGKDEVVKGLGERGERGC